MTTVSLKTWQPVLSFKQALCLLASIILFLPLIILIYFRKDNQPIRMRSPHLILISLISSFIMCISLSLTIFLNRKAKNWNLFTCSFYIFSTNFVHFAIILPYILRALRLLEVFTTDFNKINVMRYRLKESYYIKVKNSDVDFLHYSFIYFNTIYCSSIFW